jgi:plastocyanin
LNKNTKITLITLLVLIVLIVITFGVLYWHDKNKKSTTSNTTTAPTTQTVTSVTFNGTKFIPTPITVDVGTTLEFINSSDSSLWITSNVSGLDSGKLIAKNKFYSYTFNAAGKFSYSNKSNSTETGQVTVLNKK